MRQAIIWTNADPRYWRIYAALGVDELKTENKSGALCNKGYPYETYLKIKSLITYFSVAPSFCNFAQSTVQNFKTID